MPDVPWDEWHWADKYFPLNVRHYVADHVVTNELFWYHLEPLVNEEERERLWNLM